MLGEALRAARRVVSVRLDRMPEGALERGAERGRVRAVEVEALDDDRRARVELCEHPLDVDRSGERGRSPRQVDRVVRDVELRAFFHEAEGRKPEPGLAHEALDLGL